MSRAATLAAILLVFASERSAFAQTSVSEASIRAIEEQVVMPKGAQALDLYDRYYAPDRLDGRQVIVGVFLLRRAFTSVPHVGAPTAIPNAFITSANKLPVVYEGGCNVVTVQFDLATGLLRGTTLPTFFPRPTTAFCHVNGP